MQTSGQSSQGGGVHVFEMQVNTCPSAIVISRNGLRALGIEAMPRRAKGPFLLTRDGISRIKLGRARKRKH